MACFEVYQRQVFLPDTLLPFFTRVYSESAREVLIFSLAKTVIIIVVTSLDTTLGYAANNVRAGGRAGCEVSSDRVCSGLSHSMLFSDFLADFLILLFLPLFCLLFLAPPVLLKIVVLGGGDD